MDVTEVDAFLVVEHYKIKMVKLENNTKQDNKKILNKPFKFESKASAIELGAYITCPNCETSNSKTRQICIKCGEPLN